MIRRTWVSILFLTTAVFAHAAKKAPPPEDVFPNADDDWRLFSSEHYAIYSHNSDGKTRDLLHHLELMRAVFLDLLGLRQVRPIELRAVYFAPGDKLLKYLPWVAGGHVAAAYYSNPDRGTIVVTPIFEKVSARQVMFHESVHYLCHLAGDRAPRWYAEGLAELLCTMEESGGQVVLGRPIPEHLDYLKNVGVQPLGQLFSLGQNPKFYDDGAKVGALYAESWLLLHYWNFGRSDLSAGQIDQFLRYIRYEGEQGNEARRERYFRSTFGMDYAAMTERLRAYLAKGQYASRKLPAPSIADRKTYTVRKVPRAEIQAELVEVAFRTYRDFTARNRLVAAAGTGASAGPDEVLGAVALLEGHADEARRHLQRALDLGSENPAIVYNFALSESRRWLDGADLLRLRMPAEETGRLRDLLVQSIKTTPDQEEGYEMLGLVEATAVKPRPENVNLVQRQLQRVHLPSRLLLPLALVRLRYGDMATATQMLDAIDPEGADDQLLERVNLVRDYLLAKR